MSRFSALLALTAAAAAAPAPAWAITYDVDTSGMSDEDSLAWHLDFLDDEGFPLDELVLTEGGEWLIITGEDVYASDGFPWLAQAYAEYFHTRVRAMAVRDDGAFIVSTTAKTYTWGDVHDADTAAFFLGWYKDHDAPHDIALTDDGWVALAGNSIWTSGDLPASLSAAIADNARTSRVPSRIAWHGEDWVFEADQWVASSGAGNTGLRAALDDMARAGDTIDHIALNNLGGWAAWSNQTGVFNTDTIATFENGLLPGLGTTIWQGMADADIPGMSIAFITGGEISELRTYGVRTRDTEDAVATTTPFPWASYSKLVTGLAVARAWDGGHMGVGDDLDILRHNGWQLNWWLIMGPHYAHRVGQTLPEWEDSGDTTIEQLLSHQAGFATQSEKTLHTGLNPATLEMQDAHPGEALGLEWLVGLDEKGWDANNVVWGGYTTPAGSTQYSNAGYIVVQTALEDATGASFTELVQGDVYDALDMHDASFTSPLPADVDHWATPHDSVDGAPQIGGVEVNWTAAAGMAGSAEDAAKALIPLINDGVDAQGNPYLDPYLTQYLITEVDDSDYGLGMTVCSATGQIRRSGSFKAGTKMRSWGDPATGNGIVILTNRGDASGSSGADRPVQDFTTALIQRYKTEIGADRPDVCP